MARDPLARVQVEAAVAIDLHVLGGVGAVPDRGDAAEHDGRDRAVALGVAELDGAAWSSVVEQRAGPSGRARRTPAAPSTSTSSTL